MNKGAIGAICFVVGLAAGGAGGYFYAKEKYFSTIEEDREEMRKAYEEGHEKAEKEKEAHIEEQKEEAKKAAEKPNIGDLAKDYKGYFAKENEESVKEEPKPEKEVHSDPEVEKSVRIIPPNQFGEIEDYEQYTLKYTSNDYILDEDGDPIDDTLSMLGYAENEIYDHFGEYEEDSVFIRNDYNESYYEILMTEEEYVEE